MNFSPFIGISLHPEMTAASPDPDAVIFTVLRFVGSSGDGGETVWFSVEHDQENKKS